MLGGIEMQDQIYGDLEVMNIYSVLCMQPWADMLVVRLLLNPLP